MARIAKILLAVDFSETSETITEYAKMLASSMDAEILVIYSAPSLSQYVGFHVPPSSIDNFVGEIVSGAEKTMETFLNENFEGFKVTGKVVNGYPAEEILNMATDENCDLIIMGTHGRTGIDRILFGSVAEKVVKCSKIPVLTVRP